MRVGIAAPAPGVATFDLDIPVHLSAGGTGILPVLSSRLAGRQCTRSGGGCGLRQGFRRLAGAARTACNWRRRGYRSLDSHSRRKLRRSFVFSASVEPESPPGGTGILPVLAADTGETPAAPNRGNAPAAGSLRSQGRTRIKPPGDVIKLEDRLHYLLQPSLESLLAEGSLTMPFRRFPFSLKAWPSFIRGTRRSWPTRWAWARPCRRSRRFACCFAAAKCEACCWSAPSRW